MTCRRLRCVEVSFTRGDSGAGEGDAVRELRERGGVANEARRDMVMVQCLRLLEQLDVRDFHVLQVSHVKQSIKSSMYKRCITKLLASELSDNIYRPDLIEGCLAYFVFLLVITADSVSRLFCLGIGVPQVAKRYVGGREASKSGCFLPSAGWVRGALESATKLDCEEDWTTG